MSAPHDLASALLRLSGLTAVLSHAPDADQPLASPASVCCVLALQSGEGDSPGREPAMVAGDGEQVQEHCRAERAACDGHFKGESGPCACAVLRCVTLERPLVSFALITFTIFACPPAQD